MFQLVKLLKYHWYLPNLWSTYGTWLFKCYWMVDTTLICLFYFCQDLFKCPFADPWLKPSSLLLWLQYQLASHTLLAEEQTSLLPTLQALVFLASKVCFVSSPKASYLQDNSLSYLEMILADFNNSKAGMKRALNASAVLAMTGYVWCYFLIYLPVLRPNKKALCSFTVPQLC